MSYEKLKKGVVKRSERREVAIFVDGVGLDRATRRIDRKIDLASLVRGVSGGLDPVVARYYTVVPFEDDSRHRAYLDAVSRSGMDVVVRRLPPKGITRQVSTDIEMGADIVAYALGHSAFGELNRYLPVVESSDELAARRVRAGFVSPLNSSISDSDAEENCEEAVDNCGKSGQEESDNKKPTKRIITLVCPSRDISYAISLATELGAETVTADFGSFHGRDVLKSAQRWIDLSDSETIWRE